MVKRIKSSASLCGATSNNCFTVYQKELSLLLIQAESLPIAYCFLQPTSGTYLIAVKKGSY